MRAALVLAALVAATAGAETIALPKGCSGLFTVQAADCSVRTMWRCGSDAPGTTRVTRHGAGGLVLDALYDGDFVLISRVNHLTGSTAQVGVTTDPLDLDRVLAEGRDSFAYTELVEPPPDLQVWGSLALAGETVGIDGRPMLRLAGQRWILVPGEAPVELQEEAFYDADLAFVFVGTTRIIGADGAVVDRSPVDLIFAGENGFLSDTPLFGCGD